ncbi:MAG: N-acetylneuraminate synthase family protein [Pyrinomonadaceae bacterium]|nr:N-acetylneuraminate synthase family protein [Phycisphaerales bacterium]
MRISDRHISNRNKPYLIAELGVNHDGSLERALELTRAVARAGADAVKLQLFDADLLMSRASKLAAYQRAAGETDPVEMLKRLQLSMDDMGTVVELAHRCNLQAIVSVFSVELVEEAERLPWDAYKTASPDIINKPLLTALADTGKPLIVSTGASTLREVGRALKWLRDARGRVGVLQCVSSYPTLIQQAELAGIATLQEIFDGPVGYSDHSTDTRTGAWAVNMGACILEKHVTYDRAAQGPDHAASLTPDQFCTYHDRILSAHSAGEVPESAIGDGKRVLPCEEDVRRLSRQSLTTTRCLEAGHLLSRHDLTIKRPGTGIEPFRLDDVIGMRLLHRVEADMPLMQDALSDSREMTAAA